jgi:hypothetical protein
MIVQAKPTHSFSFTTSSIIPGATRNGVASDMLSAIHIYLPHEFSLDASNALSNGNIQLY